MNYLHLMSWYYTGGKSAARDSFRKLQEGVIRGVKFPFDCPYQVGLVHCMAKGEEHWCVGVLVMRGTGFDDSVEQSNKLRKWFDDCSADFSGTDKDCGQAIQPSVERTLQSRYPMGRYRVVEAFDEDRGKPQTVEAGYLIDYEEGTIPIGDLPIGARVVDLSWKWEFRTGDVYSGSGDVKPATWIIVAKDHYDGLESHVTLLAEELIGLYSFDNSTDRDHKDAEFGYNHWGESGTANATRGLRPWLNSTGIHSGEGFYRAFSESFKAAVLETTVPNREWKNGSAYSTEDKVFLPSTTELGDTAHSCTYQIGTAYPYFSGTTGDARRVASLDGKTRFYWTRSPVSYGGHIVRDVSHGVGFDYSLANYSSGGVRPALNLKSEILVSEIKK